MRTGPGLFERITGHFADGSTVGDFTPADQTFLSVRDNIERILNSRRGSLAHLPDFGLDDLSEIYRHLTTTTAVKDNDIVACQCPRGTNRVIARSEYYDE